MLVFTVRVSISIWVNFCVRVRVCLTVTVSFKVSDSARSTFRLRV